MNAREFLLLTADIRADYERKLKPLQEELRAKILYAEEVYSRRCNTEPPDCKRVRSAIAKQNVAEQLMSYIWKWATESAEKYLEEDVMKAEMEYRDKETPITEAYNQQISERLKCTNPS